MLSFEDARRLVEADVRERGPRAPAEAVALADAEGRFLAEDVLVDRDLPPFDRSTRDGFAVRSSDLALLRHTGDAQAITLRLAGEVRAGGSYQGGTVRAGTCVEIMTGAPVPAGADAVVMVEHTERPDPGTVRVARAVVAGENVVTTGSEARRGVVALARGSRVDPAAIALLATVGAARPVVHARPRVAILPTGDELVDVTATPGPAQIRNSNAAMLAAQVARAGGLSVPCPAARDDAASLRAAMQQALAGADLLVLSGGVSAGRYDLVEAVLAELGAQIRFDAVAIRPGKPVVFAWVGRVPVFGLPGNPLSTLCTFELFAAPAIALLGGAAATPLRLHGAPLAADFAQRELPLTVFLPATLDDAGAIRPLATQGSGDLFALARADCWMIVPPQVTRLAAGTLVLTMPR